MAFRNKILISVSGGGSIADQLVIGEVPSGVIDGSNTTFTTAYNVFGTAIDVYLNGLLQKRGDDYTFTSPNTIIFTNAPISGSNLLCDYIKAS